MSESREWLPTNGMVEEFLLYSNMLNSLAAEVRELSKKKQEGTLNLTKVKVINRVLQPLRDESLVHVSAHKFLDLLDEDTLPNNSDAVLIISQFEAAMREFREAFYRSIRKDPYSPPRYFWATVENPEGKTSSHGGDD